jgi:polysaccharide biosynthesis transport protein
MEHVSQYETKDYQEISLSDYFYVFLKRKWLFATPLIIAILIVLIDVITQKPIYVASSTVLIEDKNPKILSLDEVYSPDKSPDFYTTQYEILKSRIIAETVVDKLHLDKEILKREPSTIGPMTIIKNFLFHLIYIFKHKPAEILTGDTEAVSPPSDNLLAETTSSTSERLNRQAAIQDLQSKIKIKPRDGTKLVDIVLKSHDPAEAAQLVNAIAEVYVQQNLENKLDASRKAKEWLSKESKLLHERIQQAEKELHNYKEEKQIITDAGINQIIVPGFDVLKSLQADHAKKKQERILLHAEIINELHNSTSRTHNSPGEFNNNTLNSLERIIADLQEQYAELSNKLGKKHPKIVALIRKIDDLKITADEELQKEVQKKIDSMKNKYNIILSQENELWKLLDSQKKKLIRLEQDITGYESLRHDIKINKQIYGEVSRRLAETTLATAITANNVKLVERALTGTPVSSHTIIKLFIGLVLGLGCGGGLALLAEYRDNKFKNIREAEQYLGLPFLGFIPHHTWPKLACPDSPRLVTLQSPLAPASESYRALRTWIRLSQTPIQTLLIASAFPKEGRSITAANLAVSFAQLGHRVLLVDADLRQSSLHRLFWFDNTEGLSSVLVNGLEWQRLLKDSPLPNLKVLTAGPGPLNPTELLSTMRMKQLIESWKMGFDTIIFDVPVILPSIPDAAILAPHMDGVLLVHDQTQVNRDAVLEGKRTLERTGANLLGVVFNNITPKQEKHHYPYQSIRPYSYDQLQATQDQDPNLTFIDMQRTESPEQWVVGHPPASIPVAQSAHSEGLTLTLHTMSWLGRVSGVAARSNHMFLLLELEIINDSDVSHLFAPTHTAISFPEETGRGPVVAPSMQTQSMNGEQNATLQITHLYRYDALTTHKVGGFADVVEIPAQHRHRGVIVYQVKEGGDRYIFEYKNDYIDVVIFVAPQSQPHAISS